MTLFASVVATSNAVAATSKRTAKADALAGLLRGLDAGEVEAAVGFLTGEPRQGRVGVGWRTLSSTHRNPADEATLSIAEVDSSISTLATLAGPGSAPLAPICWPTCLPEPPRRRAGSSPGCWAVNCARVPSPG